MSSPVLIFLQKSLVSHDCCRIYQPHSCEVLLFVRCETGRGVRSVKATIWRHSPFGAFVEPFKRRKKSDIPFTVISLGYSYTAKQNVASVISALGCHSKLLWCVWAAFVLACHFLITALKPENKVCVRSPKLMRSHREIPFRWRY